MPGKSKEVRLKVSDLAQREDFGSGVARISQYAMKELDVGEGDAVEIKGMKTTGCIALLCEGCDKETIKMDTITRRNSDSNVGDMVSIRKIRPKEAETITISVMRKGLTMHLTGSEIHSNIIGRVFREGDVMLPNALPVKSDAQELMDKDLSRALLSTTLEEKFIVVSTSPDGIVKVADRTDISIATESSVSARELEPQLQAKVVNVRKIPELKNFMEVKSVDDIKKLITSGVVMNRFEDDKFVIYFGSNYFFKIAKVA